MAINGWELHHGTGSLRGGKIVTVKREENGTVIWPPCDSESDGGDARKFGCKQMIGNLEDLELVSENTEIPEKTPDINIVSISHTELFRGKAINTPELASQHTS